MKKRVYIEKYNGAYIGEMINIFRSKKGKFFLSICFKEFAKFYPAAKKLKHLEGQYVNISITRTK